MPFCDREYLFHSKELSRVSTVAVQRFCKPKVGGSNPSPGTITHPSSFPVIGVTGEDLLGAVELLEQQTADQ